MLTTALAAVLLGWSTGRALSQETRPTTQTPQAAEKGDGFTKGEVIEGRTFSRQLNLTTDRLTFRNCTFDVAGDALYCVRIAGAKLTLFEGCTFRGALNKGLLGSWFAARGCTFEEIGSDGISVVGDYVEISRCTFRRLGTTPGAHSDAIQVMRGSNVRIVRNVFDVPHGVDGLASNACVYIEPDFGPISRVSVVGNRLDGGLYSVWALPGNHGLPKDVVIRRNAFGRHFYAPYRVDPEIVSGPKMRADNNLEHAQRYREAHVASPTSQEPQERSE